MKRIALLLVPVLTAPAFAQKDVIEWRDGTKTKNVQVIDFNGRTITYKVKGREETAPAHRVLDLIVEDWNEVYARSATPEEFVGAADDMLTKKAKNAKLVASYGYWRAGMMFAEDGKPASALAAFEKIDKEMPESAYARDFYVYKIRYYLSNPTKKRIQSAHKVAELYEAEVTKRGWSPGFELEATFYLTLAGGMMGKWDKSQTQSKFKDLVSRAAGSADFVAHLASIQVADMLRADKKADAAMAAYKDIIEKQKGCSDDVRGRAQLGIGHLHWSKASMSKSKPEYHKAYLAFLRVYILSKDAHPEIVGEALYHAARAVVRWNGLPTANAEAARLRARLKLRRPYKDTSWAKKN